MKQFILLICLLLTTATFVSAQRAAERKAQIKTGLKEQVKLTDEQINAVVAIEDEFRPKLKAVRSDASLSEADKKTKTKDLNDQKRQKLESAVGPELAKKVEAFYGTLKKHSNEEKKKEQ